MHIFLRQIWILSCTDQKEAPSPVSYFHGDRVLVVLSEFISFVSLYTCPDENTHAHHEAACKSVQENRSFCKSPNTDKVQILITLNMSVSICLKRMCMYLCISTKKKCTLCLRLEIDQLHCHVTMISGKSFLFF